jgi:endonuclease/exonuclease/phosphatase family metal-dependent hydrolase
MINSLKILTVALIAIVLGSCSTKQSLQVIPADPKVLVVGTFNMEWLGDGKDDKKPRSEADFEAMAKVINELNADIIGVEEVENTKAIQSVLFYLPDYDFILDNNGNEQNVGFIYRKGLSVQPLGTYFPIAIERGRNRPGYMAYVKKGNFDTYMMVVHLKSTSQFDDTDKKRQDSKATRLQQAQIMANWADSILTKTGEMNIIMVGDFNDFALRRDNPTLSPLYRDTNLKFLTDSTKSCKFANKYGIDQIIVSSQTMKRFKPSSVFVFDTYSAYGKEKAERISDHCPITARFDISAPDEDNVEIKK